MFIGLNISSVDMDVDGSVHTRTSTDSTLVSGAKSLRGVVSNGSQPRSLTSDSLASRSRARKRGVMNSIQEDAHSRQFASHKRTLVTYDETFHQEKAIFFPGDYRNEYRMLTHFYAYLYFADEHTEHIYMRIVRDRLHYHDEIFCAAGRAIKLLHEEAAELATLALVKGKVKGPERDDNGNLVAVGEERSKVQTHVRANILTGGGDVRHDAVYHAVHIRRGDFQYSHTQLPAATLYNNIKHLLDPNVTKILYISTDEKNMNFFEPFRKHFTLRFLHHLTITAHLGDHHLNQNHIGMVEQTICANAHTFVGTPMSTFTGYITRMRGTIHGISFMFL